tara:strand:+ start:278 stop:769 length:492 start_codon:yes stop_codon:yes gene_type:complete
MHQLTGIIIEKKEAPTLAEAQQKAERVMDDYLCNHLGEKQGYFDWYSNHNDGRWSTDKDLESVMDLATEKGMKAFNRLKEDNLSEKKRNLEKIREITSTMSDEEILNSKDWETSYYFRQFGEDCGLGNYLYDNEGSSLSDGWWLKSYMETTEDKWLVLFDCHN